MELASWDSYIRILFRVLNIPANDVFFWAQVARNMDWKSLNCKPETLNPKPFLNPKPSKDYIHATADALGLKPLALEALKPFLQPFLVPLQEPSFKGSIRDLYRGLNN